MFSVTWRGLVREGTGSGPLVYQLSDKTVLGNALKDKAEASRLDTQNKTHPSFLVETSLMDWDVNETAATCSVQQHQ